MPNLISPETFDFFARYLLAGFIIISVRARFVVGERPKPAETAFEAVVLSLINQFVFLLVWPVLAWIISTEIDQEVVGKASFYAEILVFPTALGLLFGWNLARGWNNALLRRLAMPVQHPVRRAYDYAFTHNRSDGFIIITYQDDTVIHGYFGQESLAANDPERSDIYLERLYDVSEDGQWSEKAIGRSALVSLANIRSIEFLDMEENGNE